MSFSQAQSDFLGDHESPARPGVDLESVELVGDGRAFRKKGALLVRTVEELRVSLANGGVTSWLLEDLIPMNALTLLSGIGKGGKTTLLAHLASRVVAGQPFLARETRSGPVL